MPIKLAIFDVDGTLLRGDTACQTIARGLGRYDRMCELERVTDQDQVFAAREEMAGWYMDAGRDAVVSHVANVNWAPGAHEGIRELQGSGVQIALASLTWAFAVEYVSRQLGIDHYRGTDFDFSTGAIVHALAASKAEYLNGLASELEIDRTEIAAIGDSAGDYDMLEAAALGIFVGNELPDLQDTVQMPGADVRDIAELILGHAR